MLSDSPPERDLQWTETGIVSSFKFINKLWEFVLKYKNYNSEKETDLEFLDKLRVLINDVAQFIEDFQFNKSVAKIYEYTNLLTDAVSKKSINKDDFGWALKKLSLILQPFIPHISEEIWSNMNNSELCINTDWPVEKVLEKNTKINIAVQINGKTRGVIAVSKNLEKR